MTTIAPVRDFIVVEKDVSETKSPGGIVMVSHTDTGKQVRGTVLSVGSGRVTENGAVVVPEVCPGDRVIFNFGSAIEVPLDDKKFFLLREDAIMCVLRD